MHVIVGMGRVGAVVIVDSCHNYTKIAGLIDMTY
jgi:hypothetical protein